MAEIKFTDNSKEVENELKEKINLALEAIGGQAENYAIKLVPVDTGRLKQGIGHQVAPEENAVYVGVKNVPYAIYVEYGTGIYADPEGEGSKAKKIPWWYMDSKGEWHRTSGMKPHPYIRPSATQHSEQYKQIAEKILKQ
jgi:HK97 gp10 family phage protein